MGMTTSLATRDHVSAPVSRASCMAALAGHPVSMGAAISIVLGVFALEAPLAMIPLLLVWTGTIWRGSRSSRLQCAVGRARNKQQLRDRRERRGQRLADAGASCAELRETTGLVDEISKSSPEEVAVLELEDLLDRYAELAVDHARCRSLALANDRNALRAREDRLVTGGNVDGMHQKVLARRIACAHQCHERIAVLEEALSDILELVRLSVAQIALHQIKAEDTGGTDDAIAMRLGWSDDERT